MSTSVVVPTFTVSRDLETMAYNCAKGYKEFADQLIICEDGGGFRNKLESIADDYIFHDNWGFTANVNSGWKHAYGDYAFIVNSDTYIESGNYEDLCIPGKVTCPRMVGHTRQGEFLNGAFFVVPKTVRDERGMLNSELIMYYSDDEYYERIKDIFQQVDSVVIRHVYRATLANLDRDGLKEMADKDKENYARMVNQVELHNR